jgi:hypothetical protein
MDVEVIYRQPDGSQTPLGVRELERMPPTGEPFQMDDRQYIATAYHGPNAEGRYHLFIEDDVNTTKH